MTLRLTLLFPDGKRAERVMCQPKKGEIVHITRRGEETDNVTAAGQRQPMESFAVAAVHHDADLGTVQVILKKTKKGKSFNA